ncbi:uncharacterized protein LOC105380499 isoform X2 [Plutella xylostella]|uniref:uncharacterized protein LOC105380499 isoform X2 n=1 Tax=Plutella xylostella TaxID=51655 RepID=UPI0018D1A6B0|nr:uncharacterized protein LOC105380499 isoform X2 [Plutella xylostella]
MFLGSLIFTVFFICYCMSTTLLDSKEDGKEIRIPFPDRVLNSVLGRLERNRQERMQAAGVDLDCDDPLEILPEYTESLSDNSRERSLRQMAFPSQHFPICHLERKIRRLNTIEYEYRPAFYEEVRCVERSPENDINNEICSSLGFSCIQWNKTIHLTRRRYTSDCWETKTMVIPAGCECMWPVHRLGDMKVHIRSQ